MYIIGIFNLIHWEKMLQISLSKNYLTETLQDWLNQRISFFMLTLISLWGLLFVHNPLNDFAQLAGAVEYTDCISAEGYDPTPNECPGYETKQSDDDDD